MYEAIMAKTAIVPSTPITFHRMVSPDFKATAPAAFGGLRRERRPIRNSAASSGVAIIRQATVKTKTTALPPLAPTRYGRRQMLPRPTAAPTVAR